MTSKMVKTLQAELRTLEGENTKLRTANAHMRRRLDELERLAKIAQAFELFLETVEELTN